MKAQSWHERVNQTCRFLAQRPGVLLMVLLACNAVAIPYAGLVHDARLYSFQVLQYRDANHGNDLFFKFGSQDKYTLFSPVMAPLTRVLGLEPAFFLVYMLSTVFFYWALRRLVFTLIKDRVSAVLALLYLALCYIAFGGLEIFHVNENFLTPRIMANGLVFLGLERMLHRRLGIALVCLLGAMVLHPLMALGGLLIYLGWCLFTYCSSRTAWMILAALAVGKVGFLLYGPLAYRFLGTMDDAWRDNVRRVNPYNFPLEWQLADWLRLGIAFATAFEAARYMKANKDLQRFLLLTIGVAALGVAGGIVASLLPYALPLQGQPYRCVWILQYLAMPCALVVSLKWLHSGKDLLRAGAIVLLGFGMLPILTEYFAFLFVMAFAFLVLIQRGLNRLPYQASWLSQACLGGLVFGWLGWTAIKFLAVVQLWDAFASKADLLDQGRIWLVVFWPGYLFLLVGLLVWLRESLPPRKLACLAAVVILVIQGTFFALPQTAWYRQNHRAYSGDLEFVQSYFQRNRTTAPPTVYWPVHRPNYLWVDVGVNSYFEPLQIAGNLFSRQTALEGQRRALLVRAFELESFAKETLLYSDRFRQTLKNIFQADLEDASPPSLTDLERLSREQDLDYIVLTREFPGHVAGNGQVFIYACEQLRTAGNRAPEASLALLPPDQAGMSAPP